MALAFAKDLFTAQNGSPMHFYLWQCQNADELEDYIQFGGGLLKRNVGQFTIVLTDAQQDSATPTHKAFESDFIIQCCSRNNILPLKEFRCNSEVVFPASFDPNDILNQKLTWREAEQKYNIVSENTNSCDSLSEDEDQHPLKLKQRARTEFTRLERQKMVQFIVQAKGFNEVFGTSLWKRMEQKLGNHTWQSFKEHFLKRIMPMIETFNLSSTEVNYFRVATKSKSFKPIKESKIGKGSSYSYKEDRLIYKYVSKNATASTPLGGNQFWIDMQNKSWVPGRSWHSVRERYLKFLKNKDPPETCSSEDDSENCSDEPVPSSSPQGPSSSDVKKNCAVSSFGGPTTSGWKKLGVSSSATAPSKDDCEKLDVTSACNGSTRGPTIQSKPSRTQKRRLFCAATEAPPDFSPVTVKQQGPSWMEKKFNNNKNKKMLKLIELSAELEKDKENDNVLSEEALTQDNFDGESGNNQVDPALHGEEAACVEPAPSSTANVHSAPLMGANKAIQECPLETKLSNSDQEAGSQWPSNFTPEAVEFISDCESVSEGDADDVAVSEDSEWSEDGICWRGGIELPEGSKIKRNPVAHLTVVSFEEFNALGQINQNLLETTSEEQVEANNKVQSESKDLNHQETQSRDLGFNFLPEVQHTFYEMQSTNASQDLSQQTFFQDTNTEETQVSEICQVASSKKSKSTAEQVTPCTKVDIAVQTDPVLVLPLQWKSIVSKHYCTL